MLAKFVSSCFVKIILEFLITQQLRSNEFNESIRSMCSNHNTAPPATKVLFTINSAMLAE